jgi:hypothetical protein
MSTSNVVPLTLTSTPEVPTIRKIGNLLARLRYDIRQAHAGIDRATDGAQRIRSEMQALNDTGDSAHAWRIQALEQRADQLEAHHGSLEEVIRECGYALGRSADDQRLHDASPALRLLNINVADRHGADRNRRAGEPRVRTRQGRFRCGPPL